MHQLWGRGNRGAVHAHTDVVDDELNAIQLVHVAGQSLMLAARIDHHRHPILAGRGQNAPVAAFSHDFEIQTRGDAQAQAAWGFTSLSAQVGNLRVESTREKILH